MSAERGRAEAGEEAWERVREREWSAAIVRDAADAMVVADRDGVIRLWNAGAERLFGFTAAEAIGQSLDLIIPPNLRVRHWDGYRRVMATGESRYGHGDVLAVPGVGKDGVRRSLEFTLVALHDPDDGRMTGIAAILRDVTRRFEEVKALRRRIAELEGVRRHGEEEALRRHAHAEGGGGDQGGGHGAG